MAETTFRISVRKLYAKALAERKVTNVMEVVHRMQEKTDEPISYDSIRRWINEPESVTRIDVPVLATFLLYGLGLEGELENLKLLDVFEIVRK